MFKSCINDSNYSFLLGVNSFSSILIANNSRNNSYMDEPVSFHDLC